MAELSAQQERIHISMEEASAEEAVEPPRQCLSRGGVIGCLGALMVLGLAGAGLSGKLPSAESPVLSVNGKAASQFAVRTMHDDPPEDNEMLAILRKLKAEMEEKDASADTPEKKDLAEAGLNGLEQMYDLYGSCYSKNCRPQEALSKVFKILGTVAPVLTSALGPYAPVVGLIGGFLGSWLAESEATPDPITEETIKAAVEQALYEFNTDEATRQFKVYQTYLRSLIVSWSRVLTWKDPTLHDYVQFFQDSYEPYVGTLVQGLIDNELKYRSIVGGDNSQRIQWFHDDETKQPFVTFNQDCSDKCYPVQGGDNTILRCSQYSSQCVAGRKALKDHWLDFKGVMDQFHLYMHEEQLLAVIFAGIYDGMRALERDNSIGCASDQRRAPDSKIGFDCFNQTRRQFFSVREALFKYASASEVTMTGLMRCTMDPYAWPPNQVCSDMDDCNYAGIAGVADEQCQDECPDYEWVQMDEMVHPIECKNRYEEAREKNLYLGAWNQAPVLHRCPRKKDLVYHICVAPTMCLYPGNVTQDSAFTQERPRCGKYFDGISCNSPVHHCCSWTGWCGNEPGHCDYKENRDKAWAAKYDYNESWVKKWKVFDCGKPFRDQAAWGLK